MLSVGAPDITPQNMRFAGAPDITPQNMRFAGTPECLLGIVKAPDKVMAETHKKTHFADARGMRLWAETHKKTHFADVLKALSGARIFSQRQGRQRRLTPPKMLSAGAPNTCMVLSSCMTMYLRKESAPGSAFSAEAKCKKKEKFPRCRVVPFYKPACAGWVNSCPLLLPSPERGGLTSARRTRYPV